MAVMAVAAAAFMVWRVESHANIAGGPSRQKFDALRQLCALQVPPVMPAWALGFGRSRQGQLRRRSGACGGDDLGRSTCAHSHKNKENKYIMFVLAL